MNTSRAKPKQFMYRWPGAAYANGPAWATSERALRAKIRTTEKLSRLPRGFEVWESDGRAK